MAQPNTLAYPNTLETQTLQTTQTQQVSTTMPISNPRSWHSNVCDCGAAGMGPLLICCIGCPEFNYCDAMLKMDYNANGCWECLRSCICPCCQRYDMRQYYNISGSCCEDILCVCCCYSCVGIQMNAEAQIRNRYDRNHNNNNNNQPQVQTGTVQQVQYIQQPVTQGVVPQAVQQGGAGVVVQGVAPGIAPQAGQQVYYVQQPQGGQVGQQPVYYIQQPQVGQMQPVQPAQQIQQQPSAPSVASVASAPSAPVGGNYNGDMEGEGQPGPGHGGSPGEGGYNAPTTANERME